MHQMAPYQHLHLHLSCIGAWTVREIQVTNWQLHATHSDTYLWY